MRHMSLKHCTALPALQKEQLQKTATAEVNW